MRHFSGEFEGIRLLMLDELDAIVGGEGEDTDDIPEPPNNDEEIVVTGRRIQMTPVTIPSLPPIIIDLPPDPDPAPGQMNVSGDPCSTARSELNEALGNLTAGSPTAAAIIQAAKDGFININLVRTDATSGISDVFYDNSTKTVYWDPFTAFGGTNLNGSAYTISPTMALMHEILHWAMPGQGEAAVMRMANEIAREMNLNTGTNFDTGRDNHVGTSEYIVNDTDSINWAGLNGRPACGP